MIINVSIVNSDRGTLDGLASLIRTTPGLHLSVVLRTGHSALRELPVVTPNVILLEPNLNDLPGLTSVVRLHAALPDAFIIVLSRELTARSGQAAIQAGAHGFIPLSVTPARIVEAVREVMEGGSPLTPRAARALVERFHWEHPPEASVGELTRREEEVLCGFGSGYRAKEVADRLRLSIFTVQTHVRNIYSKLGARSTAHAVAIYGPPNRFNPPRPQ